MFKLQGRKSACTRQAPGVRIGRSIGMKHRRNWRQFGFWATLAWVCSGVLFTSSTAQGGGESFKNRKPIGEVVCCESGMAEQIH